jgi:hypothetical protein
LYQYQLRFTPSSLKPFPYPLLTVISTSSKARATAKRNQGFRESKMRRVTTYFVLQWAALALYSIAMLGGASAAHSSIKPSALQPSYHDAFNSPFASSPSSAGAAYQKAMSKWIARWITVTTTPQTSTCSGKATGGIANTTAQNSTYNATATGGIATTLTGVGATTVSSDPTDDPYQPTKTVSSTPTSTQRHTTETDSTDDPYQPTKTVSSTPTSTQRHTTETDSTDNPYQPTKTVSSTPTSTQRHTTETDSTANPNQPTETDSTANPNQPTETGRPISITAPPQTTGAATSTADTLALASSASSAVAEASAAVDKLKQDPTEENANATIIAIEAAKEGMARPLAQEVHIANKTKAVDKLPTNDKIKDEEATLQADLEKVKDYSGELWPTINFDIITDLIDLFGDIINLVGDIIKDLTDDGDGGDGGDDPHTDSASTDDPSSTSTSSSTSSSSSSVVTREIYWDTAPNIDYAQLRMKASTIISEEALLACLTPAPNFSLRGSLCAAAPASSDGSTDTSAYQTTASPSDTSTDTPAYQTTASPSDTSTDTSASPTSSALHTTTVVVPPPPTTTTTVVVVTPTAPPFGVMIPSGNGIDCHTDVDYTDLNDCADIDVSKINGGTTYSTDDNICDDQGSVEIDDTSIGNWCQIGYSNTCSLVWGQDLAFGISSRTLSFQGQDLLDFLNLAFQKCGTGSGAVISTSSQDPNLAAGGWDMSFCLVYRGFESACGTNQGIPNA